jgi:hypothetical protein
MDSAAIPSRRRGQDANDGAVSARLAAIEERLKEITMRLDELSSSWCF